MQNSILEQIKDAIKDRFSLHDDKADDSVIDERIRSDVDMRGANLWVLIFAIFVASIGLNVNSTAVIIGAMLISPLMGPIMGMGYGAGINDFALIKKSLKSLGGATIIALLTSTLYFSISPLDNAQSELLARTTPTLWDVLIALFGGLAGIVGATRKEKSNVIPGVAIATALMPPLCTAGFGLATGNWQFFFGALYLYFINFVFIAFSSFIIVRVFNLAQKQYVDTALALRAQRAIAAIVFITVIPSTYLAYELVEQEVFKTKAMRFVEKEFAMQNTYISNISINAKTKVIDVSLIGEHIPQSKIDDIMLQLPSANLASTKLAVYQNADKKGVDISALKASVLEGLYTTTTQALTEKDRQIAKLEQRLADLNATTIMFASLEEELKTLEPYLFDILISKALIQDSNETASVLILNAKSSKKLSVSEHNRIGEWLKLRTKMPDVRLIITGK